MIEQYFLGHSPAEMRRLVAQADLLAPITRRILVAAGVRPGMRVLDVGTGMGDVALLSAELVGTEGSVVGIDTSAAALQAAAARVAATSHRNISFIAGDPAGIPITQPFDAVVGRYVLMFLPDPLATLSALRGQLRSGGCIAFHELDWSGTRSAPPAPTYDQCCRWALEAVRLAGANAHMGPQLYRLFIAAGFAAPSMRLEAIIGGSDDPSGAVHAFLATMFPEAFVTTLARHRVATADTIDLATLPARMAAEIAALGSVIVGRSEIGVWSRAP